MIAQVEPNTLMDRNVQWKRRGLQVGPVNGRDGAGRLVGWFDLARNETRDANGRLIARGDLLSSLF
jgi:hypothetical protein